MNAIHGHTHHDTHIQMHWDLRQAYDLWVKGLRSITGNLEESSRESVASERTPLKSGLHPDKEKSSGRQGEDNGGTCGSVH
jgi:hypothetical protein